MATHSIFSGQPPPYKFPSDFGSAGSPLQTDGAGTLSWTNGPASFTNLAVSDDFSRTFGVVAQAGGITNTVVCNAPCGEITCFDTTATPIAPSVRVSFNVTCSAVESGDLVMLRVVGHYGVVGGFAVVSIAGVSNGSFTVSIVAAQAPAASLVGQLVLGYKIIKSI